MVNIPPIFELTRHGSLNDSPQVVQVSGLNAHVS